MEDLIPTKNGIVLYIRNPESLIFKGIVDSISSFNEKGPFDILPVHENFITIIKGKVVSVANGKSQDFLLDLGIMKVTGNVVHVFLGTESL